ncbi:MAG: hypothetical protein KAS32_05855 [Candidatus Peribacteraceae bacterium]|nr:hypothetical protein [Candidatus Peribacteraceae bacterium]
MITLKSPIDGFIDKAEIDKVIIESILDNSKTISIQYRVGIVVNGEFNYRGVDTISLIDSPEERNPETDEIISIADLAASEAYDILNSGNFLTKAEEVLAQYVA